MLIKSFFTILLTLGFLQPAQALSPSQSQVEQKMLTANEANTIDIFKKSSPLVVSVDSIRYNTDFFSMQFHEIPAGSGTGFIWDNKGHVITNFHVVQGALRSRSKIFVTTKDGKRLPAQVVGHEMRKDIAVLKVKDLKFTDKGFSEQIANSKSLLVGQKVLAIGNPFGFEQTLTQGIISALNRSMPSVLQQVTIRNMVQTDASINPGNSGGPLIDSQGLLVGMNTSIISRSGSSAGLGFAVPSNTIKRMANQIIQHGQVIQPSIGIRILRPEYKMYLRQSGYRVTKGIVIERVIPNGPASKAGLTGMQVNTRGSIVLGDILLKINNIEVDDYDDIYNVLSEKKVGDTVTLTIKRKNNIFNKKVKLKHLHDPKMQS